MKISKAKLSLAMAGALAVGWIAAKANKARVLDNVIDDAVIANPGIF